MVGVAGEALLGSVEVGLEICKIRFATSPFGVVALCRLWAVGTIAVVTTVVGGPTVEGSVVGGPGEVNFGETVILMDGATGGSVDLTVTLGGPGKQNKLVLKIKEVYVNIQLLMRKKMF